MSAESRDIFSVSRLNMEIRSALENSFPLLWVTGEISNLAAPRSGHLYFSLKDASAQVRCAMFRNRRKLLRFQPDNGAQVIVRAKVTMYEPRGDLQLIIEHMEPAGEGLLRQQVEELTRRLRDEGLFDADRKHPIPAFPRRIGIVTSPSGAAIRDVLTVLKRRCPSIPVVIYPVPVQGTTAAAEIAEMLRLADRRKECDLLILTRGGGSLEDLMAFNDEQLARTIAALSIPLISAVGHEIDTGISDHVADRRAPTPSAAAELASPDAAALLERITLLGTRLQTAYFDQLRDQLDSGKTVLDNVAGEVSEVLVHGGGLVIYDHGHPPDDDPEGSLTRLVADGEHAFTVVATDRSGNATEVVRRVVRDATAPELSVGQPL